MLEDKLAMRKLDFNIVINLQIRLILHALAFARNGFNWFVNLGKNAVVGKQLQSTAMIKLNASEGSNAIFFIGV